VLSRRGRRRSADLRSALRSAAVPAAVCGGVSPPHGCGRRGTAGETPAVPFARLPVQPNGQRYRSLGAPPSRPWGTPPSRRLSRGASRSGQAAGRRVLSRRGRRRSADVRSALRSAAVPAAVGGGVSPPHGWGLAAGQAARRQRSHSRGCRSNPMGNVTVPSERRRLGLGERRRLAAAKRREQSRSSRQLLVEDHGVAEPAVGEERVIRNDADARPSFAFVEALR
jgi:hypothetical protein